jgi:hypothetical protein
MVPLVISSGGDFIPANYFNHSPSSKKSEMNQIQTYRLVEMGKWSDR